MEIGYPAFEDTEYSKIFCDLEYWKPWVQVIVTKIFDKYSLFAISLLKGELPNYIYSSKRLSSSIFSKQQILLEIVLSFWRRGWSLISRTNNLFVVGSVGYIRELCASIDQIWCAQLVPNPTKK